MKDLPKSRVFRIPRLLFAGLFFAGLYAGLYAQESVFFSYERNFIRANLSAKTGILIDAATDEKSGEFIGDLYDLALQFALANGEILRDDPDMIALVSAAARGAGGQGMRKSLPRLLRLFEVFRDSYTRVEILGALAVLGKGNAEVTVALNLFLENQNRSFREGVSPDIPVLRACVAALGTLGDYSSFPVLFSAMVASYPPLITQETMKALDSIQGNFKDYLAGIIRNNPFPEKAAAFRLGAYNERLSPEESGELAQIALEISLAAPAENTAVSRQQSLEQRALEQRYRTSLRYDTIPVLTRLKWRPAAFLAIRNFYQVQTDYTNGAVPKERLLEAIACLGVMSTSEASQALALQLGYCNSQTERNGQFDEAIVMALVSALGELRDKAAFDYLLYIGYLNYPENIQAAAREALNRLTW
jgi:hypothetical protein